MFRALPEAQLSAQLSNCLEILNLFQPACLLQAGHLLPAWSVGGQTQGRSVSCRAEAQRHACQGTLGFGERIGPAPNCPRAWGREGLDPAVKGRCLQGLRAAPGPEVLPLDLPWSQDWGGEGHPLPALMKVLPPWTPELRLGSDLHFPHLLPKRWGGVDREPALALELI